MEIISPVIVAIDDMPDNLIALSAVIREAFPNATVLTATDGSEGIQLARTAKPDVILLDIVMPGMDGFAVCRTLKADPVLRVIPVMFLTARRTDQESRMQALDAGAEAFLSKPIDAMELTAQIKAMLKISAVNAAQRQEKEELETLVAERTRALQCELERREKADAALREAHQRLRDSQKATLNLLEDLQHENEARKENEMSLSESEQRFRMLFDALSDAVFIRSEDDTFVLTNKAATELLGYSQEELRRMGPSDIVSAEIYSRRLPWLERLRREGTLLFESTLIHRDGTRVPVEVKSSLIVYKGGDGILSIARDITERRQAAAEKAMIQEHLNQAQKMESVGRLAGGVAHDFNNMLGVIIGNIEMALDQVEPATTLHADLEEARKAAQRSAALTRQLLAFSRKEKVAPIPLDLNQTVGGMLKMLQRLIGENIQLTWEPGDALWPVFMDPSQVDQILANLCVNARDAINGAGELLIKTSNTVMDDASSVNHVNIAPGDYVTITLRDTGCGMDANTLAHIFDPFFTTKKHGEGTGLGLATVYGIVKQNRGGIEIDSAPGVGTTFFIHLPRLRDEHVTVEADREMIGPESAVDGHIVVLLCEDEPGILRLCCAALEKAGYSVLAADNPEKALEITNAYSGDIHLLITDVVMPGMNGTQLADILTPQYPNLKRLFMSGYTVDIMASHGLETDKVFCLQKPFTPRALITRVHEVLEDA